MINDIWGFFDEGTDGHGNTTVKLPDGQELRYGDWLELTKQIENPNNLRADTLNEGLYGTYPTQVEEVIFEIVEIGIREGAYFSGTTCHHLLASRVPADPFADFIEALG